MSQSPLHIKNTNGANKNFWTIREEKDPAAIVQEKAEFVYHSWKKLLRQNWIYSLGYYPIQRCVFGAGSFLNKRDKFVVCAWTPPDWLPGKMRNESFCGFLNLKRGSVCISGLMHKSKCQRQCVTGKRKITFLVFTQGLFKLMLMMKSKNWGQ